MLGTSMPRADPLDDTMRLYSRGRSDEGLYSRHRI
jgi:hypothetical protein